MLAPLHFANRVVNSKKLARRRRGDAEVSSCLLRLENTVEI
jgi:hypothetical protein